MNIRLFPGCWYTDAVPSGEYVSSHFHTGQLFTDKGVRQAPAGPRVLQWVRMSPDRIRFAGTGQDDDHAWEWGGDEWDDAGTFQAPRAVIYGADGQLHVVREATWPGTGSQGWRYVDLDGTLVPAWMTYASSSKRLWEYTTLGDVTVGQGEGGVHALVADRRVRLDYLVLDSNGQRQFGDAPQTLAVNFWRWGSDCACSFYVVHSPTSFTGVAIWLTRQEFDALPTYGVAPEPPSPPPIPTPVPEPEPDVPEIPSLFAIVESVWQKYGGQNRGAMVNEIAWRGNGNRADGPWGLSRKTGGENATQPRTGEKIAHDIVQFGPTRPDGTADMFDVFTDSGPVWIEAGQHNQASRIWIPAVSPNGVSVPDSGTPLPNSGGALVAAVIDVARAVVDVETKALRAQVEALAARLVELETRPEAPEPSRIALKSVHGKYVSVQPDGSVIADREGIGGWEVLSVEVQE